MQQLGHKQAARSRSCTIASHHEEHVHSPERKPLHYAADVCAAPGRALDPPATAQSCQGYATCFSRKPDTCKQPEHRHACCGKAYSCTAPSAGRLCAGTRSASQHSTCHPRTPKQARTQRVHCERADKTPCNITHSWELTHRKVTGGSGTQRSGEALASPCPVKV